MAKDGLMFIHRIEAEVEMLERHIDMLKTIKKNEPIGIIRLAETLRHPQHKVRYSLRILEQEGLIEPSPEGAVTTERLASFMKKLDHSLANIEKSLERVRTSIKK